MGLRVWKKMKDNLLEMGPAYFCGLTEHRGSGKSGFLHTSTVRKWRSQPLGGATLSCQGVKQQNIGSNLRGKRRLSRMERVALLGGPLPANDQKRRVLPAGTRATRKGLQKNAKIYCSCLWLQFPKGGKKNPKKTHTQKFEGLIFAQCC